jgi:hypothetical protein
VFEPVRGGRLRCAQPAAFRLGSFGVLSTTARTELAVNDMKMDRTHGVVAISSLTLGVVAGALSWQGLTRGEAAIAGETVTLRAGAVETPAMALSTENQQLRDRQPASAGGGERARGGGGGRRACRCAGSAAGRSGRNGV